MELPGGVIYCGIHRLEGSLLPGDWKVTCDHFFDITEHRRRMDWMDNYWAQRHKIRAEYRRRRRQYGWQESYQDAEPSLVREIARCRGREKVQLEAFLEAWRRDHHDYLTARRYSRPLPTLFVQFSLTHPDNLGDTCLHSVGQSTFSIRKETEETFSQAYFIAPREIRHYVIHLGYTYGMVSSILVRTINEDVYTSWLQRPETRIKGWNELRPTYRYPAGTLVHQYDHDPFDEEGEDAGPTIREIPEGPFRL